jgi:hypothetical protein
MGGKNNIVVYKEEHGHCKVPGSYKDRSLADWVRRQRKKYNGVKGKGEIKESRVKLLNDIGFTWRAHGHEIVPWEDRLQQLIEYKQEHRNMLVPRSYDPNPPLGHWVQSMRQQYKNGKLSQERMAKLDQVGFTWEVGTNMWKLRLEQNKVVED